MTREELEKIREEYRKLKKIQEHISELNEVISIYEKEPIIKKYLSLIEEYKKYTTGIYYDFDKKGNEVLIDKSISTVLIKDTNNIYVFMGTYAYGDEVDIIHGNPDYKVKRDNPKAAYNKYRNLELNIWQDNCDEIVTIDESDEFEKNNRVIFPKGTILNEKFYFDLKIEFFETAIKEGQEKAVEKVLKYNK